MFRQKDTLDMHVCNKKYFTKYIYVCLGRKIPQICMYVNKNSSQNIYMYVQVEKYLGYACIQQRYLTKIYTCLGSKIPHEEKKGKEGEKRKNKLSS